MAGSKIQERTLLSHYQPGTPVEEESHNFFSVRIWKVSSHSATNVVRIVPEALAKKLLQGHPPKNVDSNTNKAFARKFLNPKN